MDVSEASELVTLAESVEDHVHGEDAATWTERLDRRADDLLAAAEVLVRSGNHERALRLVGALSGYAQASGRVDEVRALADDVLHATPERQPSGSVLARALLTKGELAFRQAHQSAAATATEAALAAAQASGDSGTAARAQMNLARVAFRDGDAPRIFEHAEQMLGLAGDDFRLKAGAIHMLAWAEYTAGNLPAAIARFEENVDLYRSVGNLVGVAAELANLGDLAAEGGDLERAATLLGQSLEVAISTDSRYLLPSLLASAAALAGARGRYAETVELAAAADEQYALAGLTPDPGGVHARVRETAVAALGRERADELAALGRSRQLGDAVQLARSALM